MHTLQTHPGEGSQEEEMQKASKDGTGNLRVAARERRKTREAAEKEKERKDRAESLPGKKKKVWVFSKENKVVEKCNDTLPES